MTWRDVLPIHPAAELFPLMSESELRELGEDIKARGLISPIVMDDGKLLDGRNRLDAMELAGIEFDLRLESNNPHLRLPKPGVADAAGALIGELIGSFDGDPYDYVLSANLHRRHLTAEQKRDVIAKFLAAKPELSNRQIAAELKVDHKKVGAVRRDGEATGAIPPVEKTVGKDGKTRKVARRGKPESKSKTLARVTLDTDKQSKAALGNFKFACNQWLPKLNADDLKTARQYFHDVSNKQHERVDATGSATGFVEGTLMTPEDFDVKW